MNLNFLDENIAQAARSNKKMLMQLRGYIIVLAQMVFFRIRKLARVVKNLAKIRRK